MCAARSHRLAVDIENIVLTQQGGVPVLLSDVAKVQIGFTPAWHGRTR
jgi:Cu/Ag efflux pump CusA